MQPDTITVSRTRHEFAIVLAITGWAAALFLLGIMIGRSQ